MIVNCFDIYVNHPFKDNLLIFIRPLVGLSVVRFARWFICHNFLTGRYTSTLPNGPLVKFFRNHFRFLDLVFYLLVSLNGVILLEKLKSNFLFSVATLTKDLID